MKKVSIILLMCLFVFSFSACGPAPVPVQSAKPDDIVRAKSYSVEELSKLLEEDKESLIGTTIEFTAKVHNVKKGELWIDRETKYGFFICETKDDISTIQVGDEVTIVGIIKSDFGNAIIEKCSIKFSSTQQLNDLIEEYNPQIEEMKNIAFEAIPENMHMSDTEVMVDFSIKNDKPIFSINVIYVNYSTSDTTDIKNITQEIIDTIIQKSSYGVSQISIDVWSDERTLEGIVIYNAENNTCVWLKDGKVIDL